MNYVLYDDTDEEEHNANSEDTSCHPLFKKCTSFKKHSVDDSKLCQTDLELKDLEELFNQIEAIEEKNEKHLKEIKSLVAENFELEAKNRKIAPIKVKVKRLESQNSVLKEKTIDIRKENDMLVEKIQSLQKRLSVEQKVRVSVTEYDDPGAGDSAAGLDRSPPPHIELSGPEGGFRFPALSPAPPSPAPSPAPRSPVSRTPSIHEEYLRTEERRFQEAAEKIMRLEQRVVTLQNANKLNSCATCGPLRNHVIKLEKLLVSMAKERKGQLEELFEMKQEALSSAVSEKDAHLAWLEVTGEGNVHTRGALDRLRRERRDLLHRMKEENEKRGRLLSELEDSTCALFTGTIKISTLGSFGDFYSEDSGDYEPGPGCCPPEDEDLPTFQPPSDEEEAEAQEADTEDTQEDAASVKSC